ncbi:MAG: two-component regulator propeller domain-containing protein [Myxococcota bacterium]|nr:two-component regulator propeller domain-containing protein [Myxococcota bacterium]
MTPITVWLTLLLAGPATTAAPPNACPAGSWEQFAREGGGPDNDFVNAVVFDDAGRGYFGTGDIHPPETHGGGLSIRQPDGEWIRFRMEDGGLASNSVYSLAVSEGGLLVGSLAGVDRLELAADPRDPDPRWTALPRKPVGAFALADVVDIAVEGGGRAWFATTYGLFVAQNGGWQRFGTSAADDGLHSRFITALALAPGGELWVGTQGKGVAVRGTDGHWTHHRSADGGLGNDYVHDIAFDQHGRAWVGTGIGVSVFDGNGWTVRTPADSALPDADVRAVAVDGRGWVWLGTHQGIAVVDGERWSVCTPDGAPGAGPGHPLIVAAAPAPDGSMWFGSYGGGVFVWRPEGP